MDSQGEDASKEAAQLAIIKALLCEAIAGLSKIGMHLPAAHAQMALDILEPINSESGQSNFD